MTQPRCLLARRSGFNPKEVHVEIVPGKTALNRRIKKFYVPLRQIVSHSFSIEIYYPGRNSAEDNIVSFYNHTSTQTHYKDKNLIF